MIRPEFDRDGNPDETGDGGLFAAIGGAALCVGALLCVVGVAGGWFAELVFGNLLPWVTAAMLVAVVVVYRLSGERR